MLWWGMRLWVGGEYACGTVALKMMWMVLLYVMLRLCLTGCSPKMLHVWTVLLLMGGMVEALWGIGQMWNGTSRHAQYLLTGNLLNPGPYSAYLMIGAVAGMGMIENGKGNLSLTPTKGRIFSVLTTIIKGMTIVCLVVLPATWSRAAWVGTGLLALWIYRQLYWKWRWWVWGGLVALGILVFYVKQGSAEGRLIIWASALTSWKRQPWLGVGIGGFNHACAEGMASLYHQDPWAFGAFRSAGVSEFSFNALVQILVEQGVVGAMLCLTWVALLLHRTSRLCQPLLGCMVALLIFACFSYPFEMLPYNIIWVVSAALCASTPTEKEAKRTAPASHWGTAMAFGVMAILISLPLRTETLHRSENAHDASLITGMHDPYFLKDCWELLPTEQDEPTFLFNMAKMLEQKERWRDSNAILRMGTRVCSDPIFYILMGNNYRKMEMNDLAEEAYCKAFAILPNRMYPLYQLMLLYRDNDQKDKAIRMAQRIHAMHPKIVSPATNEMQEEARKLLQEQEPVKEVSDRYPLLPILK